MTAEEIIVSSVAVADRTTEPGSRAAVLLARRENLSFFADLVSILRRPSAHRAGHGSRLNLIEGFFSKLARSSCVTSGGHQSMNSRNARWPESTTSVAPSGSSIPGPTYKPEAANSNNEITHLGRGPKPQPEASEEAAAKKLS